MNFTNENEFIELKKSIMDISNGLLNDNRNIRLENLKVLRKITIKIELMNIAKKWDHSDIIPILYILRNLVNDLYINLGTDSSHDFPAESISNGYCENLGKFIKSSFNKDSESIEGLYETIKQYYTNLMLVESE